VFVSFFGCLVKYLHHTETAVSPCDRFNSCAATDECLEFQVFTTFQSSPLLNRGPKLIRSIMFVMQRRTTVFYLKEFTISCSVASCQHTKTNSVSIKVDLDRLTVLPCIAVSQLLCCSVAPSKLNRLNNWSY